VEKIVQPVVDKGELFYRVKWVGYEETWEPALSLQVQESVAEEVADYRRKVAEGQDEVLH